MSDQDDRRRERSARRYLIDDSLTSRLSTTLLLAARALDFPNALVNILDADHQHTISSATGSDREVLERSEAFCDVVVRTTGPLVVQDAARDPRFADYRSVVSGEIGTYLGIPLLGRESLVVGSMCVIDPQARKVSADHIVRLTEFAAIVEDQLDLIRRLNELRQCGMEAMAPLAVAVDLGEIVPWFQPIIELATGRTVGYEALARWEHPDGRVDEPDTFVPLAEDSDLVIDLDLSVMRQALRHLRELRRSDPQLRMSINLSGRHFQHPDWFAGICREIDEAGIGAEAVDLELTETLQMAAGPCDGAMVNQLRERGFGVVLDDFGTGWSSLEYLLRLPANGIKLDRAVSAALGSTVGDALIRAVTGLARDLGLITVIEGIETAEQARQARLLGCDFAQGFYWSGPLPAADLPGAASLAGPGSERGGR